MLAYAESALRAASQPITAAAVRAIEAVTDQGPRDQWGEVEKAYGQARAASEVASAAEVEDDDLCETHRHIHKIYCDARARLLSMPAPSWAALALKVDAFCEMYDYDRETSWGSAAGKLSDAARKIGADGFDLIAGMAARGHAEQVLLFLSKKSDGYASFACCGSTVGPMATSAEGIARDCRDLCPDSPAMRAASGLIMNSVWFGIVPGEADQPKSSCRDVLSDAFSTAVRQMAMAENDSPQMRAAYAEIDRIEDAVFLEAPVDKSELAFQLLVAVGELECIEAGSTPEIVDRANANVRLAICNAITLMGMPFDYRTAEYYLGDRLADHDGRSGPGLAK